MQVLTQEHLTAIVAIEKKSFTSPWPKHAFVPALEKNNNAGLGAFVDGSLFGYCFYYWAADEMSITNIAIDPKYRNQRVGTYLLLDVEDRARALGCVRIFLEVSVDNTLAQKLYRKLGYQKKARRLGYYDDGQDALVMSKEISI